ncbi:hypothetical protein GCM10009854_16340 [Saccharopolyspora halophila]|uniref:Uncharacterized protein n=1 Tax=Saccharopolyspora halophila TaxID=405551 RepID=A0ABP5SZC0_9PSEU
MVSGPSDGPLSLFVPAGTRDPGEDGRDVFDPLTEHLPQRSMFRRAASRERNRADRIGRNQIAAGKGP